MQISQKYMTITKVVIFLAIADNDLLAFENLKNEVMHWNPKTENGEEFA
jgi:hypothetical protein